MKTAEEIDHDLQHAVFDAPTHSEILIQTVASLKPKHSTAHGQKASLRYFPSS